MPAPTHRPLSPLEARVVGVLVEKEVTVADSYPLSLNALVAGCNQKTARDPVMSVGDAEVLTAIDELKSLHLVVEVSGSRVTRYEHNARRVWSVPSQSVALLTTLMLRGPQTAAELRTASERLHRFADVSSVEAFLDELSERDPPLVVKLPRAPGAREPRWAHLVGGPVDVSSLPAVGPGAPSGADADGEIARLRTAQARLEGEVAVLRAQLQRLAADLGVSLGD